ncbi:hypothetical protein ACQP2F_42360 [Actinoplanes sp. CA-030573]|uniref:hypothetical protein n=1 Tax=Actinoplanes sp. CA-030573 TaxID=3239898 RepID=UPI003D942792
MFTDINRPTPPEWWDARPATVRYHHPGWGALVLLLVIGGGTLLWSRRGRAGGAA